MVEDEAAPLRSTGPWQIVFWVIVGLIVVGVFVARELHGPDLSDQGANHPAVGQSLPMIELQGLTAGTKAVDLSEVKGKVVLLNFWGVWCPPCIQELPHMAEIYREFASRKDFLLLPVSCSNGAGQETLEELRTETTQFLAQRNLDMPSYADIDGTTRRAVVMAAQLDQFGYPTNILLGRDGTIRGMWVGYEPGTAEDIQRLITAALAKKSEAPR